MTNIYKLSGTTKIPKGKAATFEYEPFSTKDPKKFIDFINSNATLVSNMKDGHRRNPNITKIHNWVRVDCDLETEHTKVEKKLKKMGVEFFKVPSTNNHKHDYKFHFFILAKGMSQNIPAYKKQVEHFYNNVLFVLLIVN